MALENTGTGKAYAQTITIVKKKDGSVESSTPHSILNAFGTHLAIIPSDWSQLSEAQAAQRIVDFEQYLQLQYAGLNIQLAKKSEPIITNLTLCPLPSQKKTYTIDVRSESQNLGKVSGGGVFEEGSNIKVEAFINNPQLYLFDGWYNENNVLVSSATTYGFKVTSNLTLTARFKPAKETVIISVGPSVIDNASTHIVNMRATASKPLASPITVSGTWAFEHGVPNGVSIASDYFNITIGTGQTTGESMIISNFIAEVPTDRIQITSFTRDIESDATYNYDYYY